MIGFVGVYTRLAGVRLRPLGHLSKRRRLYLRQPASDCNVPTRDSHARIEAAFLRRLAVTLVLATVAGCSGTMRIESEHSPTASFFRYRTYDWMPESPSQPRRLPRGPGDLRDGRIRAVVETQLAAKGYSRTTDAPDFLVDYRVTRKEKSTESIGDFIKYRESGGQEGLSEAYVFGYEEATLTLEIFDAATKQRVWRAAATTANANPDKQEQVVAEAVQRLLERFPPH